ncbi:hypothetical protein HYT84_04195 [Candidatus Micrarchaeota archaeon]|nr:hypothetical protein [Candidatus Micrarchaeota archaeon]
MEEEERIKKKKLTEQHKLAEAKKAEEQLKAALRTSLSEGGYNRLMNVKIANTQLFLTAAQHLLRIFQKVQRRITDAEVLMVLKSIKQQSEKESTITFDRK